MGNLIKMSETNKKEEKFFITKRVEDCITPIYKKGNCSECNVEVGISEESYKAVKPYKDVKILCFDCFKKKKDDNVIIKRPTLGQMKELRKIIPDYDELDVRYALDKIKDIPKKK